MDDEDEIPPYLGPPMQEQPPPLLGGATNWATALDETVHQPSIGVESIEMSEINSQSNGANEDEEKDNGSFSVIWHQFRKLFACKCIRKN